MDGDVSTGRIASEALSSLVDGVLTAGEPVDVTSLLAVDLNMIDLETAISERHAAIVAEAEAAAEAEGDERQALVLAGAALLGALVLAVLAVAVVVTGRRRPPGSAGPPETAPAPTAPGMLPRHP